MNSGEAERPFLNSTQENCSDYCGDSNSGNYCTRSWSLPHWGEWRGGICCRRKLFQDGRSIRSLVETHRPRRNRDKETSERTASILAEALSIPRRFTQKANQRRTA